MRMGGLISGMDTESIVKALVDAERTPRVRMENHIYEQQNRLSAWSELDVAVNDLLGRIKAVTSFTPWTQMRADATEKGVVGATAGTSAATANYDVVVNHLARSQRIASDAQTSASEPLALAGDFTIGGSSISVAETDSLADIRDKINAGAAEMAPGAKVSASIINTSLVITRVATGEAAIEMADGDSGILQSLGIVDSEGAVSNVLQSGRNLAVSIDGIAVTAAVNTGITGVLAGVTLNFEGEGSTRLAVGHDRETLKSLINNFVAAYNNTMSRAEKYSKVQASEEGNVESVGLLSGESSLIQLMQRSRAAVTRWEGKPGVLDAGFSTLESIGIWTRGRDNRLAIVDSKKLDDALTNNFDQVEALFRDHEGGIVKRFEAYVAAVASPVDGAIAVRTRNIRKDISATELQLITFDKRMEALENHYWDQFSAMEAAMANINSQSTYLLNAIGMNQQQQKN